MMLQQQTYIALVGFACFYVGSCFALAALGVPIVYMFGQSIWWFVTTTITVYALNCSIVGQCNMYAWVMSYILIITGVFALIVGIAAFANKDKIKQDTSGKTSKQLINDVLYA